MFCLSLTGCTVGIKKETRIVYVSLTQHAEVKGAIKIATNKSIPVTLEGITDVSTELNLGGLYAISPNDLKVLIDAAKKNKNSSK